MEVIFKSMEEKDIEETIALCDRCFDEKNDYEYARKVYLETMHDSNNIYINGILDGKIIAHAKLTIIKTIYTPMATYGMLNHICVDPNYRRHHIATYLLDVLFKIAKDYNCKELVLWSKNFRSAAHACYKNYGFELVEAGFFSKEV